MKTIKDLKEEIAELAKGGKTAKTDSEFNKANKHIGMLNLCVIYLEGGPSDVFLRKEIERLEKKNQLVNDNFEAWIPNEPIAGNPLTFYSKEMGVPIMKQHLKALNFLIGN